MSEQEKACLGHIQELKDLVSKTRGRTEGYYSDVRSIVFDLHGIVEATFNEVLYYYYLPLDASHRENFDEHILSNLSFNTKKMILRSLTCLSDEEFNITSMLNGIRNAFCHCASEKSRKFYYRNKNIIEKRDCIRDLTNDVYATVLALTGKIYRISRDMSSRVGTAGTAEVSGKTKKR